MAKLKITYQINWRRAGTRLLTASFAHDSSFLHVSHFTNKNNEHDFEYDWISTISEKTRNLCYDSYQSGVVKMKK